MGYQIKYDAKVLVKSQNLAYNINIRIRKEKNLSDGSSAEHLLVVLTGAAETM